MKPFTLTIALLAAPLVSHAAAPEPRIEGLWVWKPAIILNSAEQDRLLAFCNRQHFNRLLIQIPWKAGTSQVLDRPSATMPAMDHVGATPVVHPEIQSETDIARLLSEAAPHHVAVEALDGTPYMGDADHRAETLATVDAILDFNRRQPGSARFAGIHWDIEPYARTDWKDPAKRPQIEQDYLETLSEAKQKLHDAKSPMTLSVDIPMWYDNKTEPDDNCIVEFNGQTKNLYQHVEDICDYVGIMSYRQHAEEHNGALEQVANEIDYAEKIGKFVCPAFETTKLTDTPQITFYGKTADDLNGERQKMETALKDRPGFGGMFIHNYPTIVKVLEPETAEVPTK